MTTLTRPDLLPLVDPTTVTGSTGPSGANATRGVIFKAACASSATTEAGIGVGATNLAGANLSFPASGGMTNLANSDGVKIPIPSGYQGSIVTEGAVQCDLLLSSLLDYTSGTVRPLLAFTGAAFALAGPALNISYVAPAGGTYRNYTEGSDGVSPYTSAISLRLTSGYVSTEVFLVTLTESVETTGGWITLSLSWDSKSIRIAVNGITVCRAHRKAVPLLAAQAATALYALGTQGVAGGPIGPVMRNILLFNTALPDAMRDPYQKRVVLLGHSYLDTAQAAASVLPRDSVQAWSLRGSAVCSPLSLDCSLYKHLSEKCSLYTVAHASTNSTQFLQKLTGTSVAYAAADGTAYNVVTRWRPHFVVIVGMNNDANAAAVTTSVPLLVAACVAQGYVPVFVREQNRNAPGANGGSSGDQSAKDAALVAAVAAANVTYGDMGIVDCYTPTGGATCAAQYAENVSAKIHPNLLAQHRVYGPNIAAEIDRLIVTPPSYAWWK